MTLLKAYALFYIITVVTITAVFIGARMTGAAITLGIISVLVIAWQAPFLLLGPDKEDHGPAVHGE